MMLTAHFSLQETLCPCCGQTRPLTDLVPTAQMLEGIRARLSRPIKVLSWVRCARHNARVGGAKGSYHLIGWAVDFVVEGMPARQVQDRLADHPGGLGCYARFTHVDRGPRRRWTLAGPDGS